MTETKRFLIGDAGELIDLNNHKFIDYGDECCKLLNELSDENEQLKIFLKAVNEELDLANRDCDILEEENEKLKQSYKEFEDECQSTFNAMNRTQNDLYRKIFKLKEENEQLKQHNIELINKIDFLERVIDGDV